MEITWLGQLGLAIFSAQCKKPGIPCYIAQIYETLDPERLLKEELCEK